MALPVSGKNYWLQAAKIRFYHSQAFRYSSQSKGTNGSKKLLKRLSGRERRFVSINNHAISKQVVAKAKAENKEITTRGFE
jgi:hypothetical protein